MSRRVMLIDLDAFFVSVEQVLNPELKGKPVIVGGKPDRRGVVAAASYEARKFGVHSAMPLTTAYRLCPQAIFIEGNFSHYREASGKFMSILADFSPDLEPMSLDEAYMDVTGFESTYGSIRQMAVLIRQRIKQETGLCASVGIANSKVMAKVACEKSKPDGVLEIAPGEEAAFLAPLPVDELPGIGKKTERVLKGLDISTIGQLAAAPANALKERFGIWGELMQSHARGIDSSQVEPPGPAKSISRETTFGEDTRDNAFLEATLRYLSERVGADLRQHEKQARCVQLKLRYADFTTITRRHTLTRSDSSDQVIFDTGLKLLKGALTSDRRPVRLIGIGVSGLVEGSRQLDMLDSSSWRWEKLDKAIDRIRDKYGFTAIQTGRTLRLKEIFRPGDEGYTLPTPGLSR